MDLCIELHDIFQSNFHILRKVTEKDVQVRAAWLTVNKPLFHKAVIFTTQDVSSLSSFSQPPAGMQLKIISWFLVQMQLYFSD